MAITSYATLQDTVARWAGNSSDTGFAEAVRDAIGICEGVFNSSLRVPEMIKRGTLALDEPFEDLPPDFIEAYQVYASGADGRLRPLGATSPEGVGYFTNRTAPVAPATYALIGNQIRSAPMPTDTTGLTVEMVYYAQVPPLSDAAPANAVLARYPRLYLLGSLVGLEGYLVSVDQLAVWKQNFAEQLAAVNREAQNREGPWA